jgi:flagellar motor switch protein FliM
MLRTLFERIAAHCSASLQHISAAPLRLSLRGISSGRMGDILSSYAAGIAAGDIDASSWNAHLLAGCDRAFLFTLTEALLGGDGVEPPIENERPFSKIELRFAQVTFEHLAEAIQAEFAAVGPTTCKLTRMVTREDISFVGKPASLGVVARMALQAIGRNGELFVLIPQAALAPLRSGLARDPAAEHVSHDAHWSKQFEKEIGRAAMQLRGVMSGCDLTLGDIAALHAGQVLPLQPSSRHRIKLECNGRALFWCQLGQSDGRYTLRIEDYVDEEQEFINDVLAN